jgi:hypothetical protein
MLSVYMLSVYMLIVYMLTVIMLSVIMLNVVAPLVSYSQRKSCHRFVHEGRNSLNFWSTTFGQMLRRPGRKVSSAKGLLLLSK